MSEYIIGYNFQYTYSNIIKSNPLDYVYYVNEDFIENMNEYIEYQLSNKTFFYGNTIKNELLMKVLSPYRLEGVTNYLLKNDNMNIDLDEILDNY